MATEEEKISVLRSFYLIPLKEVQTLIEANPPIALVEEYIIPKNKSLAGDEDLLRVAYSGLAMRIYGYGLIKAAQQGSEEVGVFYDQFNEIADDLQASIGQEVVVRPDLSDPEGFRKLKLLV